MTEQVDVGDLKSPAYVACRFESCRGHHTLGGLKMSNIWNSYDALWTEWSQSIETTNVLPLLIILGIIVFLYLTLNTIDKLGAWKVGRGKKMSKKLRKEYLIRTISDGVTDLLENLVYKGKITREEASHYYKRLGYAGALWDLFPRRVMKHPNPAILKHDIKERIDSHKPVPLPDAIMEEKKPRNKLELILQERRKAA